jgi:hypothetical protein
MAVPFHVAVAILLLASCLLVLCLLVVEKMTMQIKFVSRNDFLNAQMLGWRWRQKSKSLHPS